MALSNDLAIQFAKVSTNKTKTKSESTVYGEIVSSNVISSNVISSDEVIYYVMIDGSDSLTPASSSVSVKPDDRVSVLIKDHSAIITGNLTDPSASSVVVKQVGETATEAANKVGKFETVMADNITTDELTAIDATIENLKAVTASIENLSTENLEAINANIDNLKAKYANIERVDADTVTALNADIDNLKAQFADIDNLTTDHLEAIDAYIGQLKGYNAEFTYVSAEKLKAVRAEVEELDAKKIDAEEAEIKFANIDFANITEASIEKLFSESGIIRDLVMSEGHVTGKLVGVTIVGDLIEGGTVKADKLVVQGEDGLYYKLNVNAETVSAEQTEYNSLSGSIITAKSITAEKVNVDDLVAFDATIGGFKITDKSIYSGVKESADNTTRGIYLDNEGQVAFGDSSNYLRYFKDQNGKYKLEISAESIILGSSNKSVEEYLSDIDLNIEVGAVNLIRNSTNMIFADYYFDNERPATLTATYDEFGNVTMSYGLLVASSDGEGGVTFNTLSTSDDGAGNVTLTV